MFFLCLILLVASHLDKVAVAGYFFQLVYLSCMMVTTRRTFLQSSSILLTTLLTNSSFDFKKHQPRLSFSTLGCPDWEFQKIVDFATANNYTGIELRGIKRELDLTKCDEFKTPQVIQQTMSLLKQKDLHFVDLGSSCNLHIADASERKKNLDEGRTFIDLAKQLHCPYIRVFPNIFPKDQEKNATMDRMISGLLELGDHAKGSNVTVLMETHGDMVHSEDIEKVMTSALHPHVGLVWDVANMWSITKEPPVDVYKKLKKYIRHTHIKDGKMVNGSIQYVLLGEGDVPIFSAIDALHKDGYRGYYSFEWEKLWHPEIAEPQIALADYPIKMKHHFA